MDRNHTLIEQVVKALGNLVTDGSEEDGGIRP